MMNEKGLMHEMMIDVFLDLQEDDLTEKTPKELLLAWVTWIDARYKVAVIPNICYAIVDCETGDLVSMFNSNIPNAKQQANEMCAKLNHLEEPKESYDDIKENMLNAQDVANAFLDMDDDSFMDFLLGHISTKEKEE